MREHFVTGRCNRRAFLLTTVGGLVSSRMSHAQPAVTRPVVSENGLSAGNDHAARGRWPSRTGRVAQAARARALSRCRVVSWRDHDGAACASRSHRARSRTPVLASWQPATSSLRQPTAAVMSTSRPPIPSTTRSRLSNTCASFRSSIEQSIVVGGCSGGGDLALHVASRTSVCAVVAEEPAMYRDVWVFNNSVAKRGERYTPEDGFFLMEDGRRYYTAELQKSFRAKLAKLDAPILIVQGDVGEGPISLGGPGRNRFNADVLIPELRATRRQFDVKIYHEQAHCFCSASGQPRPGGLAAPASWPAAALRAFQDIDAFCRRHVQTKPKALDAELVTYEPVRTGPVR